MISQRALEAIEASDTDELLRVVDGYCKNRAWSELLEMRQRCIEALSRGKQLWGVDEHIRYRLALEAPAEHAGPVLAEGAARFALGPLPEVAASTKTWVELAGHITPGPERSTFAAERVVRGDVDVDEIADLPARLQDWEPIYQVATYKPDKMEAPSPRPTAGAIEALTADVHLIDDPDSEGALSDLVSAWTTESNGRSQIATVQGGAAAAIAALGLNRAAITELEKANAVGWMAWAGASGGAHGRRRGAAAGRFGAWWALATLCDLDWPPDPDEVAEAVGRLAFYWFDDGSPGTGWNLRLAIEDPESGLAWAISAVDSAD